MPVQKSEGNKSDKPLRKSFYQLTKKRVLSIAAAAFSLTLTFGNVAGPTQYQRGSDSSMNIPSSITMVCEENELSPFQVKNRVLGSETVNWSPVPDPSFLQCSVDDDLSLMGPPYPLLSQADLRDLNEQKPFSGGPIM